MKSTFKLQNYPLTDIQLGIWLAQMVSADRSYVFGECLSNVNLLSEVEREQVLYGWNRTEREYPADKCVHELFEEQAARTPEATALVFEEATMTYAELNRRANHTAHYLIGKGIGLEDIVAMIGWRSHQIAARYYEIELLPIAIHLFGAKDGMNGDDPSDRDPMLGWSRVLPLDQITRIEVPGNHLTMMEPPNISLLGEAITTALAATPDESGHNSPTVTIPVAEMA
jgi:hypothetical protein